MFLSSVLCDLHVLPDGFPQRLDPAFSVMGKFHSDSRLTWTKSDVQDQRTTKGEQLSSDECN